MPPKSNQVTLSFDKLTEQNLQPIIKKFKKAATQLQMWTRLIKASVKAGC